MKMTEEEVKKVRAEVELRTYEQDINAMCEFYKKIKECLSISDDSVANKILDYADWWNINYILSHIEKHPNWREVFKDEIERLEHNRAYFEKRHHELTMTEKEHELPWWKRLFGRKNTQQKSTTQTEDKR